MYFSVGLTFALHFVAIGVLQATDPYAYREDPQDYPLLPSECGTVPVKKGLGRRVVGGEGLILGQYPWMTLLEYSTPNGPRTLCGGSLISKRYVLTAAHCVSKNRLPRFTELTSVRLGEHNTETNPDCMPVGVDDMICADEAISVGIEETHIHVLFESPTHYLSNDISLLRLNRDVYFTKYIQPICLPWNNYFEPDLVVAGWGMTDIERMSNIRMRVKLPVFDANECQNIYMQTKPPVKLGKGQVCAGGEWRKDSCRGDSGGPLVSKKMERNNQYAKYTAVGIVSFGATPCGDRWPGVYTKVYDYMDWILNTIRP